MRNQGGGGVALLWKVGGRDGGDEPEIAWCDELSEPGRFNTGRRLRCIKITDVPGDIKGF